MVIPRSSTNAFWASGQVAGKGGFAPDNQGRLADSLAKGDDAQPRPEGGAMIDLVIRGDTVVTPQGVGAHDILIAGGRIAAMAAPGPIPLPEGVRVIDATGKIVMPGGI